MSSVARIARHLYAEAEEKGFWKVENAEVKHMAKIHAELSEALEEDRRGRPMLYVDDLETQERITDVAIFRGRKPEGAAAEIADFAMMSLELARHFMIIDDDEFDDIYSMCRDAYEPHREWDLPGIVLILHNCLAEATAYIGSFDINEKLFGCQSLLMIVAVAECWLQEKGFQLFDIIQMKLQYNRRNRAYLHGKRY